jgi:hypothetical protein
MVYAVVVIPIGPAVEFCEVGAGADCERRNSTMKTPLALWSSWGAVLVIVFVFGVARPFHHPPLRHLTPLLENGGRARSQRWRQRRRRFRRESS